MSSVIAFTAQWLLLVPAAVVAAVVLARRRWRPDILEAAAAGLITILFVKIGGAVFDEKRPFVVEHVQPLVPHGIDNAFPSDHLAACGLAFAYLWPRSRAAALVVLLCAAAIAYARVAARLHWPGDVGAGFAFGVLAVLAVRAALSALPSYTSAGKAAYSPAARRRSR